MTELLIVLASLASAALEPHLEVELAPTELTVGDRAEVVVSLTLPDGIPPSAVEWPEWPPALGEAEVLEVGPVEPVAGPGRSQRLVQRLDVTFFRVGELSLPPLTLKLPGDQQAGDTAPAVLRSEPVKVTVRSVLPEGDTPPEPKPAAPPRSLSWGEPFWWMAGGVAMTCMMVVE